MNFHYKIIVNTLFFCYINNKKYIIYLNPKNIFHRVLDVSNYLCKMANTIWICKITGSMMFILFNPLEYVGIKYYNMQYKNTSFYIKHFSLN